MGALPFIIQYKEKKRAKWETEKVKMKFHFLALNLCSLVQTYYNRNLC